MGIRQGDHATATKDVGPAFAAGAKFARDRSAESLACYYLGVLSNAQGEYVQVTRYFAEAKRLAKESGETGSIMKVAACVIWVWRMQI